MKSLIAIVLLMCGMFGQADDPTDAVVKRLSQASIYAFGGVGFVGKITRGELDYRLILSLPKPEAEAAFEKVYASNNPQAKAYALNGMKQVNPARFKELAQAAQDSQQDVTVGRGCVISREPLSAIAKGLMR